MRFVRPIAVLGSLILLRCLSSAYTGGVVGVWLKDHETLSYAAAGLLGHLGGACVAYLVERAAEAGWVNLSKPGPSGLQRSPS